MGFGLVSMTPVVSCHRQVDLHAFQLLSSAPGRFVSPDQIDDWSQALTLSAPGTVAESLAQLGQLSLSNPPDLDGQDYWLRTQLPNDLPAGAQFLVFEGLATLADVWLNDLHVLRSENMYRRHELHVGPLTPGGQLTIRFGALRSNLAQKRPRPRFRTRLVDQQQLRWLRTSLLGRTPGFSPRTPVVGPYRPVRVLATGGVRVLDHRLHTQLARGGATLFLSLTLQVDALDEHSPLPPALLTLQGDAGSGSVMLPCHREAGLLVYRGTLTLPHVEPWWPHTHGAQPRSSLSLAIEPSPAFPAGQGVGIELGMLGFRDLRVTRGADGLGFRLICNGESVFCRGACWTVDDLIGMSDRGLGQTLQLVRDGGMNMLRVGGTTSYESDAFYEACDALGIMVFQDFMFANMDYPVADPHFAGEVHAEVTGLLERLSGRPCLSVLCGGSEVEQQVAMLGLPSELRRSPLFDELLPTLCAQHRPDVPYVSNSPCEGALPFQVDAGIAHYYGVGAYLRPLSDARLSRVRFAAECLAFANVPDASAVEALLGDLDMPFHHPLWKERVPRDRGVGWDFEDVRDHYLELLYRVDARRLRHDDPARYLTLSRAVVVDVMEATIAELRRTDSQCGGALVFWLKDLWLGAGWGVLDARSRPKSAYYGLKRSFAPVALLVTDEGMNGPELHVVNDTQHTSQASLHVALYRAGRTLVSEAIRQVVMAPRSSSAFRVEALFERFVDPGYVYRFGPANHDLLVGLLRDAGGTILARAFVQPLGVSAALREIGLSASFETCDGRSGVLVESQAFAQRVEIEVDGYVPDDNYFQLEPGGRQWVGLRAHAASKGPLRGRVSASNGQSSVSLTGVSLSQERS